MSEMLLVALAMGFGAFFHTTMGFGSSIIAMPLLALMLPVSIAAPAQTFMAVWIVLFVLYMNRQELRFREALTLIIAGAVGLPFGLLILHWGAPAIVSTIMGLILAAYAAFALFIEPRLQDQPVHANRDSELHRWGSYIAGFAGGVLGAAYATNGPPVVAYGAIRRWPKQQFRSILQTFFLVNNVIIVGGHTATGLLNADALRIAAYGSPGVILGMLIGARVDKRIDAEKFRPILLWVILALGILIVAQSLTRS